MQHGDPLLRHSTPAGSRHRHRTAVVRLRGVVTGSGPGGHDPAGDRCHRAVLAALVGLAREPEPTPSRPSAALLKYRQPVAPALQAADIRCRGRVTHAHVIRLLTALRGAADIFRRRRRMTGFDGLDARRLTIDKAIAEGNDGIVQLRRTAPCRVTCVMSAAAIAPSSSQPVTPLSRFGASS
jgi:hypothetical protein